MKIITRRSTAASALAAATVGCAFANSSLARHGHRRSTRVHCIVGVRLALPIMLVCARRGACLHAYLSTCLDTYLHTYLPTYIHTSTHSCMYPYTHACAHKMRSH